MSLYAKINSENIVENIIVCDDTQISNFEGKYIKQTVETKDASIGSTWDTVNSKFIAIKPYESWSLDENFDWKAPAEQPVPNSYWNEETQAWVVREIITE